MSIRIEKSIDLFNKKRFHRSQAVLGDFAEDLEVTEERALSSTDSKGRL